jgi:hypothetical protein
MVIDGAVANVVPHLAAIEMDLLGDFIRAALGHPDAIGQSGDA